MKKLKTTLVTFTALAAGMLLNISEAQGGSRCYTVRSVAPPPVVRPITVPPPPVAKPVVVPPPPPVVRPVVVPPPVVRPVPVPIYAGHGYLPGYGRYFQFGPRGIAPGRFGMLRPSWYGPLGRYPKRYFHAPLRRGLGLAGFTPLRQLALGRGAQRRQVRRAVLFGRHFGWC